MKASNGLGSSRSILLNDDDDRIELAGQYFAGSVIEQAVRDWRKAKASGFITREGTIDGTMIQAYGHFWKLVKRRNKSALLLGYLIFE
jgi:hypothetical protein